MLKNHSTWPPLRSKTSENHSEESFPDDPLEEVFGDVFHFDWHDTKLRETLHGALQSCGFEGFGGTTKGLKHDGKRRLPKDSPLGIGPKLLR